MIRPSMEQLIEATKQAIKVTEAFGGSIPNDVKGSFARIRFDNLKHGLAKVYADPAKADRVIKVIKEEAQTLHEALQHQYIEDELAFEIKLGLAGGKISLRREDVTDIIENPTIWKTRQIRNRQ